MEIPVINRMSEFEASINSLNHPSLISRFFDLGKSSLSHPCFFQWGALFLALVYAFSSLASRLKLLILHYHHKSKSLLASASDPLLSSFDDDFSDVCSSDDDASSSDDDDDDEEVDIGPGSSHEDLTRFHDDFRIKGSFGNFRLRRRRSVVDNFSLSDLANGNGVVKLWENSILGEIPTVSMSPSVIVAAGAGEGGVLGLGLWDLRLGRKSPAVQGEWRSGRKVRTVGFDSGRTGKVYVRDDLGMAVGDVRKVAAPLENLTEFEDDRW